jgi:hypothetical protein
MPLLIRIDVDRPYGRSPFGRHVLSRLSSDLSLPPAKIARLGFLKELKNILQWLNAEGARAYVFFRRCTLPSSEILQLLESGGHEIGMHLENSRSFATFVEERRCLERYLGRRIVTFSKHGSGGAKFGFHHYAPYEPEKYVKWAQQAEMKLFLGNLQDPSILPLVDSEGLSIFPSAFWLEPPWRDVNRFSVDWLVDRASRSDVVMLIHPENILASLSLTVDFKRIIGKIESRIL